MLPSSCAHVFEGLFLHLLKLAPRNQSRIVVLVDVDHNIVVIDCGGRVGHPDLSAHVPYPRGHHLLPLFTQLRATTDTLPPHSRRILKRVVTRSVILSSWYALLVLLPGAHLLAAHFPLLALARGREDQILLGGFEASPSLAACGLAHWLGGDLLVSVLLIGRVLYLLRYP